MRIEGRCTSVVRFGDEVAIQIRGDEKDRAGVLQGKAVVIFDAASDPVAEYLRERDELLEACAKAAGTHVLPTIAPLCNGRFHVSWPGDYQPKASATARELLDALRALRASLEPEEQPVPETVEECDAECHRRLPNNKGIMCENEGDADTPRWRVYTRNTVVAAYLAIDAEYHTTCLAAWQAAVRKLRKEAAKCR